MSGTIDRRPDRPSGPSTVVLVAAYDEADRIERTLAALASALPGAELWVADDGSADGTAELARAAGARVVRSERVIGKGAAVTLAAREALARHAGDAATSTTPGAVGVSRRSVVFLLCDGDLAESAARLGPLVRCVRDGEADLAVAAFSRRVGGGVGLALGFARWAIRRRCGSLTTAPISGQRALAETTLRDVLPFAEGFGMEIGMTIDAVRAGHRLSEVELDLSHRSSGRTPAGFLHRGRQLLDFVRVYRARR